MTPRTFAGVTKPKGPNCETGAVVMWNKPQNSSCPQMYFWPILCNEVLQLSGWKMQL
jgi:hypothetical protein